ncbi:MAG: Crp/Fnr family transcriptional regulator [Pseudomonadota bacterium]|uniref:Crp/Fnr family transcriptional regulator n=1 Tax=unclassified Ectothiorhodospira TaxID=2684909 RepID=UPI001EE8A238|nr:MULTISPECIES: Crp/Fnr family transcriptional regulator [unclassified Ectothiorhodospira]MCG5516301.1 Crp/Fnr family transcriptional regulator [Ectothiorhodospira sp. 9100]MCG5519320.1 Crp/Fnr family transcriptional regulator [Ectothiorhodospira sp. 9905]
MNPLQKDSQQRLVGLYRDLPEAEREMLLAFAEFLATRGGRKDVPVPEPQAIPRPEEETVIKAMKRLSSTYPMLDKARLLNETSMLMSQHMLQGREAREVIDDLEAVFARHYRELCEGEGER